MPPRKRQPAAATKAAVATTVAQTTRKVTRTLDVITTLEAARALTTRAEQDLAQAPHTFQVERIAGPRDTGARWRFNIPGQLLVVAEDDLPIISALIETLRAERMAKQL